MSRLGFVLALFVTLAMPMVPSVNAQLGIESAILNSAYLTIDTPPVRGQMWSQCSDAMQAYCVEPVMVISPDGSESAAQFFASASCGAFSPGTTEKCQTSGADHVEVNVGSVFSEGEMANTYRWKIRTGRIEPTVLMLGDTQKTDVVFTDGVGWSIEIWAKPAMRSYEGCTSPTVCDDTSVAGYTKIQLSGYLRMVAVGDPMVDTLETRDSLRGTFISTNAMSQAWEFRTDTMIIDALSPHYLPDGQTLNPGFVKVFIPSAYLLGPRGFASLEAVTMDKISVTLNQRQSSPSLTTMSNGVLIDTGVTHYSNPRPKVRVKPQKPVIKKKSRVKLSSIYKTKKSQKPQWQAKGACSIKSSRLVASSRKGTCTVSVKVLQKRKYVVGFQRTFAVR